MSHPLLTAELWGGPFDGERAECLPAPAMLAVYEDPDTRVQELGPYPPTESAWDDWQVCGFYQWSDAKRLSFSRSFL